MSTPSKRKGSGFEVDLKNLLRNDYQEDVERLTLHGSADEADLYVRDKSGLYILIECKAEKSMNLSGGVGEALVERDNFANSRSLNPFDVMPVAVFKRPRRPIREAYLVTTVHEYFRRS